jgi:hypothetical protein
MLTKNDFAVAEWTTLRDTPHLVGLATLLAGSSGLGTVKESMALAQAIIGGQSSQVPLIRDLASRPEMEAAQQSFKGLLSGTTQGTNSKEEIRRLALDRVAQATSILGAKATAEETEAFSQWLYSVAEGIAKAAKEGGFLGFGGTQVSEGEQAFLSDLRNALHLQPVR